MLNKQKKKNWIFLKSLRVSLTDQPIHVSQKDSQAFNKTLKETTYSTPNRMEVSVGPHSWWNHRAANETYPDIQHSHHRDWEPGSNQRALNCYSVGWELMVQPWESDRAARYDAN